jgi:rubrerythrin
MVDLFASKPTADDSGMAGKLSAAKRAEADAKSRYDKLHQAGNDLLRGMRNDHGCTMCGAPNGKQHSKRCPAWPFIETRVELYD